MEIIIKSLEDTEILAEQISKQITTGDIICLVGDLGTGKTTFSKGLCNALGVSEPVTSPTFSIVNEYHGRDFKINHFDVYRLGGIEELYDIGFDEYIFSDGSISIIEWADIIDEALPKEALWIFIDFSGESYRRFTFKCEDSQVLKRFEKVLRVLI